jgi:tRNA(Ile)-lysidine synthase
MPGFDEQLSSGLRRCGVVNEKLLLAVSGGADSVALLRGLIEVSPQFSRELCVAHLNHRLRGAESDSDAAWVAEVCQYWQLPCEIGVVPEGMLSQQSGSVEENARNARYRFLEQAAAKFGCSAIVLAHTADDQTETVLHHLLRGTGIRGLRGIPAVRTLQPGLRLVRPMLGIRRRAIEQYLEQLGQSFRVDSTNTDHSMTRNRLRHLVLPMLREHVNEQVDSAIHRLVEQATEIDDFLHHCVERLLNQVLKDSQPDSCRLEITELAGQPRHLVRDLFRELWQRQGWPRQAMGYEQWNRLVDIIASRETMTLPGRIEARFHGENLLVLKRTATSEPP